MFLFCSPLALFNEQWSRCPLVETSSPTPQHDLTFDRGAPTRANRDRLLLAAHAANARPFKLVADMGDGLKHVEGDAGNDGVAYRPAEFAIADFVAAIDSEHEFAGRIRLAVREALCPARCHDKSK